jgi:hypothetical protein
MEPRRTLELAEDAGARTGRSQRRSSMARIAIKYCSY